MESFKEKTKLVSAIKSSHDARLAVFEVVSGVLNQEYLSKLKNNNNSGVWDANDMIPYVNGDYAISINSLQFSCKLGNITFNYSVALNLGEVRLGIIVPANLSERIEALLHNVEAYPPLAKDPAKVVRNLSSHGYLLDHVYTERFGSMEITKEALQSRVKGSIEIDTIGDAIARELIHLNHSLMHTIANHGYLVTPDNIYDQHSFELIDLYSKEQPSDLIKELGINYSQLFIRARNEYSIMIPNDDKSVREKVMLMNQEFLHEKL